MATLENLLAPGSSELPDCRCGAEMHLFATKPQGDTEIRVFKCDACHCELQLMVWNSIEERDWRWRARLKMKSEIEDEERDWRRHAVENWLREKRDLVHTWRSKVWAIPAV